MSYNADSIKVLKGLQPCRVRPGMYIGNVEFAPLQMLKEVLDNSIDEHLAGHCSKIKITLTKDGYAIVEDNGRGIPVDIHEEEGISAAIVIMTQLHAGGKFDQNTYKISGGLHGVGVSVVNALSDYLELRIFKDGHEYFASFSKGDLVEDLKIVGSSSKKGTFVKFIPDTTVVPNIEFDLKTISARVDELAYLNKGLKIILEDDRIGYSQEFFQPEGIKALVKRLNTSEPIHEIIEMNHQEENVLVTGGLVWGQGYKEEVRCFTNNIPQSDGGTHLVGFRTGLTRCINNYIQKEQSLVKRIKDLQLSGEDVREGLACVISVYVPEPQFSSQTKEKLVSQHVRSIVERSITKVLEAWLEENPIYAKQIVEKIMNAALAREAARKSRDLVRNKGGMEFGLGMASKLAGCTQKDPTKAELFIVEGQSAGGNAKQARNRLYQAVLPLRGKILNIEKAGYERMLDNEGIRTLIAVMGTGIGETFDITRIRYNKIIIMTDADVDGSHILTLLLTFFFRYMRAIIENGYLYIAKPPLYGLKQGSKMHYLLDDAALGEFLFETNLNKFKFFENENIIETSVAREFIKALSVISKDLKKKPIIYQAILIAKIKSEEEFDVDKILEILRRIKPTNWEYKNEKFIYEYNGLIYEYAFSFASIPALYLNFIHNWAQFWGADIQMQYENEKRCFENPYEVYSLFNQISLQKFDSIQRYKGLGEMNADELKDAMKDCLQVRCNTMDDAETLIANLMGENVAPRKEFIAEFDSSDETDD